MKNKCALISKAEVENWLKISNIFARSLCKYELALKQFNQLDAYKRTKIKKCFEVYDNIRRKNIPKNVQIKEYQISVMVDFHIIATEFNIDPLTVALCINPLCKSNERISLK